MKESRDKGPILKDKMVISYSQDEKFSMKYQKGKTLGEFGKRGIQERKHW